MRTKLSEESKKKIVGEIKQSISDEFGIPIDEVPECVVGFDEGGKPVIREWFG